MSFVRIRKSHSGTGYPRKKRALHRKPVWDDTIHDLTQLKATPEEMIDRKVRHKSKHAVGARLEKQHRAGKSNISIASNEARQLAIMKEVLYNQQQFQNVLAKSDRMMSVVKDLFGDDPKRYTGIPNITSAPGGEDAERSGDIVAPLLEIQTKIEALSDSVMDGSALNDIDNSDSDDESPDPIVYEPKFNMARFQQFLQAEERNQSMSTISGQAQLSQLDQGPIQSTQIQDTYTTQQGDDTFETPKKNADESISILRTPRSAINDTRKVKKSKKRVVQQQPEPPRPSNLNLTDLRKVLEHLEDEIADYERQTGRRAPAERQRQETFSGYTLSLVDSVTKLTRYLKESELRLGAEMTIREQLTQDVFQLRALIDALTSDIIITQEEYAKLQSDYKNYKQQTQDELLKIKSVLLTAGLYHSGDQSHTNKTPPKRLPDKSDIPHQQAESHEDINRGEVTAVPSYMRESSGAVLLSPPVRKTRIQREGENVKKPQSQSMPMRQTSLLDLPDQNDDHPGNSLQNEGSINHVNGVNASYHSSVPPQTYLAEKPGGSTSTINGQFLPQVYSQGQMRSAVGGHGQQIPQNLVQGQQWSQPSQIPPQSAVRPQMHPAAAKVNVPRPSPLVQSNVGVAIQGNVAAKGQDQFQGQSSLPSMQQSNKDVLASQIAELNKQHEEAQKRLEMLLKHQYQSDDSSSGINDNNNSLGQPLQSLQQSPPTHQQQGLPAYPVSPPISPISQGSDPYLGLQALQQSVNGSVVTRGITVSIPSAELELSAGSSPSPRTLQT